MSSIYEIIAIVILISTFAYFIILEYLSNRRSTKLKQKRITIMESFLKRMKEEIKEEYYHYLEHERLLLPNSDIFDEGSKLKYRKCNDFQKINFDKHLNNFISFLTFLIKENGVKYYVENPLYNIFDMHCDFFSTYCTLATLEYSLYTTNKEERDYLLSHYFIWLYLNRKQAVLNEIAFIDEYNDLQEAFLERTNDEMPLEYLDDFDDFDSYIAVYRHKQKHDDN